MSGHPIACLMEAGFEASAAPFAALRPNERTSLELHRFGMSSR